MSFPVTGPVVTVSGVAIDSSGAYRVEKHKYRQRRPYNLNLPYYADFKRTNFVSRHPYPPGGSSSYGGLANPYAGAGGIAPYAGILDYGSQEVQSILAKARRKLSDLAAPTAEALVDLIEMKRTAQMVTTRTVQLLKLARAVKRLDPFAATQVIKEVIRSGSKLPPGSPSRTRKAIAAAKSPANAWLEIHFGWAPLIGDLVAGLTLLEADFKPRKLYGKAKGRFNVLDQIVYRADESLNGHDNGFVRVEHTRTVKCKVGADIRIDNPNLLLANRLGFVNPLTVINEIVPFSFVVDWFGNWSQWLGQWSEFMGFAVTNAYHTVFFSKWSDYEVRGEVWGFGSPPPHWDLLGTNQTSIMTEHAYVDRRLGMPGVELAFQIPSKVSLIRAATAASLLVQTLKTFPADTRRVWR